MNYDYIPKIYGTELLSIRNNSIQCKYTFQFIFKLNENIKDFPRICILLRFSYLPYGRRNLVRKYMKQNKSKYWKVSLYYPCG